MRALIKAIADLHPLAHEKLPWQQPIALFKVKDASLSTLNGVRQADQQVVAVGATVTARELALFVYQIFYFPGPGTPSLRFRTRALREIAQLPRRVLRLRPKVKLP